MVELFASTILAVILIWGDVAHRSPLNRLCYAWMSPKPMIALVIYKLVLICFTFGLCSKYFSRKYSHCYFRSVICLAPSSLYKTNIDLLHSIVRHINSITAIMHKTKKIIAPYIVDIANWTWLLTLYYRISLRLL
jgi:hypothetical protein